MSALLRALFADQAFAATRGQLVKQPVEWVVGALRQLGVGPATCRRQAAPAARRPRRARPGAAAAAERRRLAGRRGLAHHVVAAGPAPARPPRWPRRPARPLWTVSPRGAAGQRLDALARLLAVDAWTDRTRAALTDAAGDPRRLLTVGLVSPEYTVS